MATVPARNHPTLVYALSALIAMGLGAAPTDIGIIVSGILIAILGIPHGSLDLHLMSTRRQRLRELVIYIICIGFVLSIWLTLPTLMLALFLINSAWHFGDCDIRARHVLKPALALAYGMSVLMVLVDLRDPTISGILYTLTGSAIDASVIPYYSVVRLLSSALVIGIPVLSSDEQMGWSFLKSTIIVAVAMIAPSLIAFTWYFVFVHSWTSMDRLRYHVNVSKPWTWRMLIAAAAPLSLVTYLGIALGYIVFSGVDILAMLFIALSALTVPHSRLFHRVYRS